MRQHRNPRELALMIRRRGEAIAMSSWSREYFASQPLNKWRKRHPFDCGRPKCGTCHSGPKGRPQEASAPDPDHRESVKDLFNIAVENELI